MISDLASKSLPLASITIPSVLYVWLAIDSALSLTFSLSLLDYLRIFPRYFHYFNRELSLTSTSIDVYYSFLWISLASLFATYLQLLASLMTASILVQNLALTSSNLLSSLCLRYLSYLYLISSISYLVPYRINPNYPPLSISLYSQNIASPCLLISWRPVGPFRNENCSIS